MPRPPPGPLKQPTNKGIETISETILMIPSQLCTAEIWRPQTEALSERANCLIGDQTRDDSVAGMAARMFGEAPGNFALAAQGMGGFVAFEIMRQAPGRVSRLLLMSTIAAADTPAQIERRRGYEKLVKQGRFDELIPERIPLLFHPDRAEDKRLVGIAESMAAETGPEAFLRQQEAIISRPDSTPSLAAIACPTMLVVGRQDRLEPWRRTRKCPASLPDQSFRSLRTAATSPRWKSPMRSAP